MGFRKGSRSLNEYMHMKLLSPLEGTIMFLNPAAERFFNCQAGKSLGQHIYSLVPHSALFAVAKSGVPLLFC